MFYGSYDALFSYLFITNIWVILWHVQSCLPQYFHATPGTYFVDQFVEPS